jgi:hypothetical protein
MSASVEKMHWCESTVADAIEQTRHREQQAWVFLRQVPNGTSSAKTNIADAIAIGCWKSQGLDVHGYEIKVSRADWQREIQDHKKAEAFSPCCHYWWIAAPAGVVKVEEMPANWGFIEVGKNADGKYTAKVRKAVTRNDSPNLTYAFFAAALRKAKHDNKSEAEIQKLINETHRKAFESGRETERKVNEPLEKYHNREFEQLKKDVADFERMAGVTIRGWRAPQNAAEAIAHYLKDGHPLEKLKHLHAIIGRMKSDVEVGLDVFEKAYQAERTE